MHPTEERAVPRPRFKDRLSVKQAQVVLLLALALGLLFSVGQIAYDLHREQARIEQSVNMLLGLVADAATQAAYRLDAELAAQVVTGLVAHEQIEEAELQDDVGNALALRRAGSSRYQAADGYRALFGWEPQYQLSLIEPSNGIPVGLLRVRLDMPTLAQAFLERSLSLVALRVLRDLLLALVLMAVFHYMIARPLQALASQLGSLGRRRDDPAALAVPARQKNSELGILVHTFNQLWSDRKVADERIRKLAFYDELTGLPNRRLLLDRLDQAWIHCRSHGHVGALLILDLDRFKTINDSLGHRVGDLLLQQVAHRLETMLPEGASAGRLGGDEFVVLLPELGEMLESGAAQVQGLLPQIHRVLAEPYQVELHQLFITTSIGITLFPDQDTDSSLLLKQADTALYRAKEAGRNNFRFYRPRMQQVVDERLKIERGLHQALLNRHFELHYQPQVDSAGRIIGAEALLRWRSPEQGLISPATFIPVAEETGLIKHIGDWVLAEALQQWKQWQAQGLTECLQLIAINVSPVQFQHPLFVQELEAMIARYQMPPEHLELELTENMFVRKVELATQRMQQLRGLGLKLALDDFGTGYSSLNYLRRLPLDRLKIDQSFVRDLLDGEDEVAIVSTIITLAENLRLEVIAEGVETGAQRDRLLAMGCAAFQGYHFYRPLPVDQFTRLLCEQRPPAC